MSHSSKSKPTFKTLATWAGEEERTVLRQLPKALRQAAREVPILHERRPSPALVADGLEPDLLGLFVGVEYAEGAQAVLPAQILLFLENLWEFAEGDSDQFREEVRITLLHELGHYLGLDEDELAARGLE